MLYLLITFLWDHFCWTSSKISTFLSWPVTTVYEYMVLPKEGGGMSQRPHKGDNFTALENCTWLEKKEESCRSDQRWINVSLFVLKNASSNWLYCDSCMSIHRQISYQDKDAIDKYLLYFDLILDSDLRWQISEVNLCATLSLLCPFNTFILNIVVKRWPYKLAQSVSFRKLCSFLSWVCEDKNTIPPPSIKCILYI